MNEAVSLFRCLGEETRFRIICELYRTDSYVELLASRLGLTPGTISFHLKKMEADGLVKCSRTQFYMIYSLNREVFDKTIESYISEYAVQSDNDDYRKKVLDAFFKGKRLIQIPVQQKKREIVLSEIMKDFGQSRDYPEAEVNEIIKKRYDDFCTVRRWLVSDGFMSRDHEKYTVLKKQ